MSRRYLGPVWSDIKAANRAQDRDLIQRIAKRAWQDYDVDRQSTEMDVLCVHTNDVPLDLSRLLIADAFNFAHDIGGIRRHLCRVTGKLQDCFVPRFAA